MTALIIQLFLILKNTILKAIHNPAEFKSENGTAVSNPQKYNFESNSQLTVVTCFFDVAVSNPQKYNFESNSQQGREAYGGIDAVSNPQKYNFESNSQQKFLKFRFA